MAALHTFQYRTTEVSVFCDVDNSYISFVDNNNMVNEIDLKGFRVDKKQKVIHVYGSWRIVDINRNVLGSVISPKDYIENNFALWYGFEVNSGSLGFNTEIHCLNGFIRRYLSSFFGYKEDISCVSSSLGFYQPLVVDLEINGNDITVTTINGTPSLSEGYSLDGVTWQNSNTFIDAPSDVTSVYLKNDLGIVSIKQIY